MGKVKIFLPILDTLVNQHQLFSFGYPYTPISTCEKKGQGHLQHITCGVVWFSFLARGLKREHDWHQKPWCTWFWFKPPFSSHL